MERACITNIIGKQKADLRPHSRYHQCKLDTSTTLMIDIRQQLVDIEKKKIIDSRKQAEM